jgi:type I restriction enzyme M protein
MASIRDLLNQVWSRFRRVGSADDLTIIEHIAALLLPAGAPPPPNTSIQPRTPQYSDLELDEIQRILAEATSQAHGVATLFDRYVLFRLPRMLSGGGIPHRGI